MRSPVRIVASVAVVTSILAGAAADATTFFDNGNKLLEDCRKKESNVSWGHCTGYIASITDVLETNPARQYTEVWVVCGPVLPSDPVMLNGRVSVPTGFYKIVTRDTPDGMAAAAYFFMHEPQGATATLEKSIFTIDAIERRTGLDFFASLPDAYESQMEAQQSTMSEPALADGQAAAEESR